MSCILKIATYYYQIMTKQRLNQDFTWIGNLEENQEAYSEYQRG